MNLNNINNIKTAFAKSKASHLAIGALSLAAGFMLFLYAPLEIYLTNTDEFWFTMGHLLPIALCFFVAAFILSFAVLEILLKLLPDKAFRIIYSIGFAGFIGLYIQGNYIPRNYGLLDGSEIIWSDYKGYAAASIIVFLAVAALAVLLATVLKKHALNIGKYGSLAVTAMLLVALISIVPNAFNNQDKASDEIVVTDHNQFAVSEGKNIIVLCLDAFDANLFRLVYLTKPDMCREELKDFTFYNNSVGAYPVTDNSVLAILTGQYYMNQQPFKDFVKAAYNSSPAFNALKANGYDIGVYVSSKFMDTESDFIENTIVGHSAVKSPVAFAKKLYKVVLFNYMPHQLKKNFVVYTGEFDDLKGLRANDGTTLSPAALYDPAFYSRLTTDGLTINSDYTNSFKYIHLNGAHPPYTFGENVAADGAEHTQADAAYGCVREISEFIAQLKKAGVYDNTALIILADHGNCGIGEMNSNPTLLVKGWDEHHDFEISDNYVSWEDITPTIVALAENKDNPNAVWNQTDSNRVRRFIYYDNGAAPVREGHQAEMTEYNIIGHITDDNCEYKTTGVIYN